MITNALGQRLKEIRLLKHCEVLDRLFLVGLSASSVLGDCVEFLLGLGDIFLQAQAVAKTITNRLRDAGPIDLH